MTTFTSEDVKALLTDWFPADVDPVHEGEYEVQTKSWPWPHRMLWTTKRGWEITHEPIVQWRGLKIRIPE